MKIIRISTIVLVCLLILTIVLAGCEGGNQGGFYNSLDDLQGADKTFSLWVACGYEPYVEKAFPEGKMIFGDYVPDLALNVKQGKADAMVLMEPSFNYFSEELSEMTILPGSIGTIEEAFIFSSTPFGDTVRERFNSWLESAKKSGVIEAVKEKWMGKDKSNHAIDYSKLDPGAEHIRVGLASDEPPHTFLKNKEFLGFDTELIVRFCEECGYYPEINEGEYTALIVDAQTDRYDLVAVGYEITEERKNKVSFSDAVVQVPVIVAVKKGEVEVGFMDSISDGFRKTFIEDNRAMQFWGGIKITTIITVCSMLFGTILGFGIYFLNRDCVTSVRRIIDALSLMLSRVPSVVLLMVFYYIIFSSVKINSTVVSIILFTILFGFSTFETLMLAVNSVGKGQVEAAFTLGMSKNETFFHVLLPQGRMVFLSGFKDNVVALLLETAVVGYISVVDLTRVGDIIRNNTYEAFFPLIAVAIFYLIISTAIIVVIEKVEKHFNPMNRTDEQVLQSVMKNKNRKNSKNILTNFQK